MSPAETTSEPSPLERAVELLVYAPLGLVFAAREELPRLIEKGREGAAGQVGMARVVGQFAVTRGQKEAGRLLRQASERLADLGVVPATRTPTPPSATPAPASGSAGKEDPEPPAAEAPAEAPPADTLAIPGYDALSASQVVQRLDGLATDELEAVRAYEAGKRGRKTVLSRIAQLQSSSGS